MQYSPQHDERAWQAHQEQLRRQAYWNRQAFKLIYVLFFAFGFPLLLAVFFAIFLAIYDPQALVRATRSKPQEAVDKLDNPSFFVREAALKELTAGTPDRSRRDVAEKIKKRLHDSHWPVQERAIDALGDWGQPEDAEALADLMNDRMSTFIRPRIIKALGKLQGDRALELLIGGLGMSPNDQAASVEAICQFGPAAEKGLLAHEEPDRRAGVCMVLKSIGTAECIPYLEAAAEDENAQTAKVAKEALETVKKRVL